MIWKSRFGRLNHNGWMPWFAWRPVKLTDKSEIWVWLQKVWWKPWPPTGIPCPWVQYKLKPSERIAKEEAEKEEE